MKHLHHLRILVAAACINLAAIVVNAQPTAAAEPKPGMVTLNFPDDLDLKVLIDYVGKRQGINFIYDEQIGGRKVTIKTTQQVPADSLLTLLESALKMKGLALAKTEVPGMMRIELAKALTSSSSGPKAAGDEDAKNRPTLAVTRVIELKHASNQRIEQVVTPFLSVTTANIVSLPERSMVIVTDYADNMKRIEDLISLIDRPGREVLVRFVPVVHLDAEPTAQKISQLLAGKAKSRGPGEPGGVTLVADERSNQVAVMGNAEELGEAIALIKSLDIPLGLETKVYTMVAVSPEQVDRIVKKLIGEMAAKRQYKSATEQDANLLIATTTPEIHAQIETLRLALEKPKTDQQSPIRFYKLENAKAADLLSTLESIEGDKGLSNVSLDGQPYEREQLTQPLIKGPTEAEVNAAAPSDKMTAVASGMRNKAGREVKLRDARMMADEATNTLIVIAKPAEHAIYEKLIKRLDVRRPQVLVEATVFILDTTNDFSLGVEIHSSASVNGGDLLNFTKFGLTTPNSLPGNLTLSPGTGFTGALLKADIAEIVIKALEKDSRVKVVSRPSVLVNDNASGTLLSESEEPFASVNASSTVATTSFAGYSSAGTNIRISPQISEGDYLKLKYEITLSSFGEDGSDDLPPSRQKNTLASEATIPDGYTIVVGGLTRESLSSNVDRVPILGRIPVLEYLLSSRSTGNSKTTLFVFIRAVVLRDDKFKDLKVLSGVAAAQAGLPGEFPPSEPVTTK